MPRLWRREVKFSCGNAETKYPARAPKWSLKLPQQTMLESLMHHYKISLQERLCSLAVNGMMPWAAWRSSTIAVLYSMEI